MRMVPLYRHFAKDWAHLLDWSDDMLIELYEYESRGKGSVSSLNGFAEGKKWMDVTIAMWREDIRRGTLFRFELYEDPDYPHWWLDKVLG